MPRPADTVPRGDQERGLFPVGLIIAEGFGKGHAVLEPGIGQVQQGKHQSVGQQASRQRRQAQAQVQAEKTQDPRMAAEGVDPAVIDMPPLLLLPVGLLKGQGKKQAC